MSSNGGFTLIELILVTVIIGILASMVVVNYGGYINDAKVNAALGDIASLSSAIDMYLMHNNDQYPDALEDLVSGERNYLRSGLKKDPWGNPYNYTKGTDPKKADFEVWSSGPDGESGTEDDVTKDTTLDD